jgi:hypothetical protein
MTKKLSMAVLVLLSGCTAQPSGEQVVASIAACSNHGGTRFVWGRFNRDWFDVTCNDDTEITGKIKL